MNLIIEKYQAAHKNQLLHVWEKSVLATHQFLDAADFEAIKAMLQNFDFGILTTYCLMANDELIGFIGIHEDKIEMLFLNPDYIGQNLGRKLMDFVFEKHPIEFVDVNEQNTHAVKFYKKFGFETFERTEKDDMGMDYPILKMKINNTK